jgi:hypothetical protein
MRASLIFSSTSHSINVQKVIMSTCFDESAFLLTIADLQDCALESLRLEMHHSRDRKCWRAAAALPDRCMMAIGDDDARLTTDIIVER